MNDCKQDLTEGAGCDRKPYERAKSDKPLSVEDRMRGDFEHNRNVGSFLHEGAGPVENLPCTRAAIAGSLAGVVDAIEKELTTLNARKELLEEELYKYKAAADLMLKQMTNEQN